MTVDGWVRERPRCRGAEGECKNSQAKGSDLDDTSESAGIPHTKGATESRWADGNLSGEDGGRMTEGVLLSLFVMCFLFRDVEDAVPYKGGTA